MKGVISIFFLFAFFEYTKAQIAEIPFELHESLILIKVFVNDQTNANTFILDTGATTDLIDRNTAEKLGLKSNYKQDVTGAGGIKSYDIILSQKLRLNNAINVEESHLVLTDLSPLQKRFEKEFDGIVGYSLLKQYIVKIDYENQKIIFFDKFHDLNLEDYHPIPFEFANGIPIPQFDVVMKLKSGDSFTGRILFDSGAGLTLLVNTPYHETHGIRKKVDTYLVNESENLSGTSKSERIAISSLKIGAFELGEMVVDLAYDNEGVSSYKDYLGILGAEVIGRFNIVFDYSNFKLYLKPNAFYNDSFSFPVSGIRLIKENDDVVIHSVDNGCYAHKKGIREGDKLIAVNNDHSKDIHVYRHYLSLENSIATLTVMNSKGKKRSVKIRLKRLL